MTSTKPVAESSSLSSFRDFAREIRKPKPYHLGATECKGVLNILIGSGQLLVCPCFKMFKAQKLYEVHIEAGQIALKQGVRDLSPAIAVIAVVGIGLLLRSKL